MLAKTKRFGRLEVHHVHVSPSLSSSSQSTNQCSRGSEAARGLIPSHWNTPKPNRVCIENLNALGPQHLPLSELSLSTDTASSCQSLYDIRDANYLSRYETITTHSLRVRLRCPLNGDRGATYSATFCNLAVLSFQCLGDV